MTTHFSSFGMGRGGRSRGNSYSFPPRVPSEPTLGQLIAAQNNYERIKPGVLGASQGGQGLTPADDWAAMFKPPTTDGAGGGNTQGAATQADPSPATGGTPIPVSTAGSNPLSSAPGTYPGSQQSAAKVAGAKAGDAGGAQVPGPNAGDMRRTPDGRLEAFMPSQSGGRWVQTLLPGAAAGPIHWYPGKPPLAQPATGAPSQGAGTSGAGAPGTTPPSGSPSPTATPATKGAAGPQPATGASSQGAGTGGNGATVTTPASGSASPTAAPATKGAAVPQPATGSAPATPPALLPDGRTAANGGSNSPMTNDAGDSMKGTFASGNSGPSYSFKPPGNNSGAMWASNQPSASAMPTPTPASDAGSSAVT